MTDIQDIERRLQNLEDVSKEQEDRLRNLLAKSEKAMDIAIHAYKVDHYGYVWQRDYESKEYVKTNMRVGLPTVPNRSITLDKLSPEVFTHMIIASGAVAIGSDGYWYIDGVRTNIKAQGDPGKDADVWTIGDDGYWYLNGKKTEYRAIGKDGHTPLLRPSSDGMSLEISSDGGETWLPFINDFNKLRVIGYVDSTDLLPKNANIGDIYGVWNPDVYSGRVDEEGNLIKGAYDLYINTVKDWLEDYTITKVYDYDTELPSAAKDGTTVMVPVTYLTLDKEKVDGYKVYRFVQASNGWVMILNTAEIYASKDDIINYGDNAFALVQGDTQGAYQLYRRQTGWVYFGTNASITYHLVQRLEDGTSSNILSGEVVRKAIEEIYNTYGRYEENPEFIRVDIDAEGHVLWGIKTDGDIFFGCGVPSQIREYVEMKVKEMSPEGYGDIINFLDGIEFGDRKLQELLDDKTDKEEGKSLIDAEYAAGIHYEENPEFIEVKLDAEDRILEAIYKDGTKLLPAGYNIGGNTVKSVENPEFLSVWLDGQDHILAAIKTDGDIIFGIGVPTQVREYIREQLADIEERIGHYEENPEFIEASIDADDGIIEAIRTNGRKYLPAGVDLGAAEAYPSEDPEHLMVDVDSNGRIINSIDRELENVVYGGINISELKRDIDAACLEAHTDTETGELYTIENNDSTISLEMDGDWNVYEVKDSRHAASLSMDDETGVIYIEETLNEN